MKLSRRFTEVKVRDIVIRIGAGNFSVVENQQVDGEDEFLGVISERPAHAYAATDTAATTHDVIDQRFIEIGGSADQLSISGREYRAKYVNHVAIAGHDVRP